jgi:tyrosyl-tRNA synthetase
MDLLADLQARGLVHDSTDPEVLGRRLAAGPLGVYVGFDPTGSSLHVGHLLGQVMLRRFQLAGHRPFPLAGGAPGMVGDPSGRSDERNLLDRETLEANVAKISVQLERLLDFEPGPFRATLVDNSTWTAGVGLLEFLRDVGKHFTVNQMVAKESVRARMESGTGISFTEFSYMLLQANDYRHLHTAHGVELQAGGSDQWGNITAGIELVRRTSGAHVHGLTWPLLLKSDGTKFGKTASGSVWLDPELTSPYQFRQFWMQADDADVRRYLRQFTLLPLDEVEAVLAEHAGAPERRVAQRRLAGELTAMVHGHDAAAAAEEAAHILFGGEVTDVSEGALGLLAREVPTTVLPPDVLHDPVRLLVAAGLAASNGEARRLLEQGGARANGTKLAPASPVEEVRLLPGGWLLLRRGRTSYHLVRIDPGAA